MQAAIARAGLEDIQRKVLEGVRLSGGEGLRLMACHDINVLGHLANIVRERKNGNTCFFVRNQHINYTNVCNKDCKFCAFYVRVNDPAGYTLSPEDIRRRVEEQAHEPITEIHMVAGINPRLPYAYYLDIIRAVKSARPGVMVKAYTMIEIAEIVRVAKKPLDEVWSDLRQAGLDSLPGGGAEVLSDRVHAELFQLKQTPDEWLDMARSAHRAGLRSNATMLYGHIETHQERIEHLLRLREVQDDTGGFLTFIPLAFHPENTELSHLPSTTGMDDLKQLAVARLMLDNFDHVKSFWIMVSPQISQLSLWYGADDIDGTILREEITHAAGARTPQGLTRSQLVALIEQAGRVPVERDPLYRPVAPLQGHASPGNGGMVA